MKPTVTKYPECNHYPREIPCLQCASTEVKPTVTLIKELRKMADKRDRNNYDIGHYWNAVEEAADAIERVLTERDEAIREVERLQHSLNVTTDKAIEKSEDLKTELAEANVEVDRLKRELETKGGPQ